MGVVCISNTLDGDFGYEIKKFFCLISFPIIGFFLFDLGNPISLSLNERMPTLFPFVGQEKTRWRSSIKYGLTWICFCCLLWKYWWMFSSVDLVRRPSFENSCRKMRDWTLYIILFIDLREVIKFCRIQLDLLKHLVHFSLEKRNILLVLHLNNILTVRCLSIFHSLKVLHGWGRIKMPKVNVLSCKNDCYTQNLVVHFSFDCLSQCDSCKFRCLFDETKIWFFGWFEQ